MSAPEQKLSPEPVITSARTPRSRPASFSVSRSATHSSGLIAFLRRGRLSVRVRTPSLSSDSRTGSSVIRGEAPSIAPRQLKDVGPQEVQNHLLADRCDLHQSGLTEVARDVVLLRVTHAAVGLQCPV